MLLIFQLNMHLLYQSIIATKYTHPDLSLIYLKGCIWLIAWGKGATKFMRSDHYPKKANWVQFRYS
jgi:hypothetical protein